MNADFLDTQLVAYPSLREALGFQMRAEKLLLPEFVAFVKAQEHTGPIRARMALEWACQESTHRGPSGAARRLSIARGFLLYLQASVPDTDVPNAASYQAHGDRNRISSRQRSSRPCLKRLTRVIRIQRCVRIPYPP